MGADAFAPEETDPTGRDESSRGAAAPGRVLRFQLTADPVPTDGTIVVVLDTTWAPASADDTAGLIGLRDVVERVLASRDLIAEATERLDRWADDARVAGSMAVGGVSFWYGFRLGHWMWLLDQLLWLAVVDELLATASGIATIECGPGTDADLVEAARRIAVRDGLALCGPDRDDPVGDPSASTGVSAPVGPRPASAASTSVAATSAPRRQKRSLAGRIKWRLRPPEPERRRRIILRRLRSLERDGGGRLLVVQAHVRQRIETPAGPRLMNPFLGPIVDRLRGTRLEPFEVDIRSKVADDTAWTRLMTPESGRTLPLDVLTWVAHGLSSEPAKAEARRIADAIEGSPTPLVVAGVDLGPALASHVAMRARPTLARRIVDVERIRSLLRRVRPAGILLADEYHRQDWLGAAMAEGIPTAAVQHGVIYRFHTGYIHRSRPPELRLPDRTYVFGEWERTLLTTKSVYRPDEVRVGGSPRLDLMAPMPVDREAVRDEFGVAPGDRLVVLSGTWGTMYRRFHYPIALASLFDRPTAKTHIVVKQHPAERDDGPYRQVIENLAMAGGFDPPPVTTVQSVDLYRLLAAADAHLGIHSTLITEAVATGTPNLLAAGLAASDLLGYVDAGVAIPVHDAGGFAAALDRPREEAMRPVDREAFLRAHFEPGVASQRIADDLLAWMR